MAKVFVKIRFQISVNGKSLSNSHCRWIDKAFKTGMVWFTLDPDDPTVGVGCFTDTDILNSEDIIEVLNKGKAKKEHRLIKEKMPVPVVSPLPPGISPEDLIDGGI